MIYYMIKAIPYIHMVYTVYLYILNPDILDKQCLVLAYITGGGIYNGGTCTDISSKTCHVQCITSLFVFISLILTHVVALC